ncbi:non-ribosomal peptide synthetase [Burkholderia thailandensis]|uniref:non-ribosomal peptide synthetase n=1 Tax=Burkholderia thailandensis TaxID=57975 RepID=UPI0002FABEA2|nr:non-ribosomal peptide synthetase [Burkholderia thailandensis]AHI67566.1 amino acid adenylation domain protein [Burkholderia thailandensis H0587]MCS3393110.1 non-ribosomal peptide synthetase [Burkholderia thailandensis]MCS6429031.1 non-ribosomal peptide synthetase [Burkholderia thailandensis]MCS6454534.1 non-ribosomal peptide synthetase [Burkholderia thailandensis]MCS6468094.1 non-ribosomal peptide synthetase [Burkholderia thailandensis]
MDATHHKCADTVLQLYEAQVARAPDRTALIFQGTSLTYGKLDARANRLARHLTRNGPRRGEFIAICLDRSIDMIAALLGILKAGAAYVPLDPEYPDKRLQFMIEDCKASAVITSRAQVGRLQMPSVECVLLDELVDDATMSSGPGASDRAGPDDPLYCIYTSGSTGRPKGVVVSHAGFMNHHTWQVDEFELSAADTFLQRTSISFDASVWEIWTPLALGARLIVLSAIEQRLPFALVSAMVGNEVTVAQFVPTLLNAVVKIPQFAAVRCRLLFCGGEVLSVTLAQAVKLAVPCELVNLYGPTEATIDSLYWRVADIGGSVPIGRPISHAKCYLLDEQGRRVADGEVGEIHLAGRGLAIGYRNRPDLTKERFIQDPFDVAGARMYRTGDMGRVRADGAIEYTGRIDDQVKVRGFRIELSEIEAAIKAIEGAAEAAVVLVPRGQSGPMLAAYVQPKKGARLEEASIHASLTEMLPGHMVPHSIVVLPQIPLTVSGKVDRVALANSELAPVRVGEAPETDTERLVAEIWAKVLNRSDVSATANFFQLGGDSLSATQIIIKIGDRLKKIVDLRHLYQHPTVRTLASFVDTQAVSPERTQAVNGVPKSLHVAYAHCLPGIGQIEILDKPDYIPKHLENVTLAYRLGSGLNIDALHAAFDALSLRHEELRVTFYRNATSEFRRNVSVPVTRHHFVAERRAFDATISPDDAWIAAEIRREAMQPVDLTSGPLMHYRIVQVSTAPEWLLLVTVHHIVFDGWSTTILQRELSSLYSALIRETTAELPKLDCSYQDCVSEQRRKWEHGELRIHENYWRKTFASMPFPQVMPWKRERPENFSFEGARFEFSIEATVPAIDKFCNTHACSPNYVLLAAYFLVLARHTGQRDICVRSPMANRRTHAAAQVIGYFVQPSAFRIVLEDGLRYLDVVRALHDASVDAWEHAELPPQLFEACVDESPDRRFASPFQFHFNYQPFSVDLLQFEGVKTTRLGVPLLGVKTDLSLSVSRTATAFSCAFSYYTGIFCRDDMEMLAANYIEVLRGITARADEQVAIDMADHD